MTNKEYIRWLKLLDDELTFDALVDGKDEMDMHEMIWALCEKLEQEPCEPVGNSDKLDCISRQAVLEEIIRFSTEEGASVECSQLYCDVNNMPSVTPAQKMGHWDCGDDMFEYAICSSCKHETGEAWEYAKRYFKYCPNCGAKMEG